jgi:tetratricopeptide (TPR) repeat protein
MLTAADAFETAIQYYRAGQLASAQQMFCYVLALAPEHAETLHFLGGISLQLGESEKAVEFFRRAAQAQTANPVFWNDLGATCIAAGRFAEGAAAIEQALRLRPDYPEAYNNLALASLQTGDVARAVECYEHAIRLRPDYAEAYSNLGNTLREQGQAEAAVAACEQALRLRPESAEAANNLGLALQETGQVEAAVEHYRNALQIRPHFADAANNLATAMKELGRLEEAAAEYRRALKLNPNHPLVYYNLSQLVADGRTTLHPEEFDRLKALVDRALGSPVERSVLNFALAAVLETQGSYDEAFHYYRRANDLRKQYLLGLNRAFDVAKHVARVDAIIDSFDEAYFESVHGWGADSELPVFILGMPRSGTTLVEQILASHPEVFGAGELGEMPRLMHGLATQAGNEKRYAPPRPLRSRVVADELGTGYLQHIQALGGPAQRVTVKTLENYLHLGIIATLYPRARVIYCRRDPLDVCVSCYCQNFQGSDFSWSLEDIGVYYRQVERLMKHWQGVLPIPIHEVRYEELIEKPEPITRALLDFCGLPWHPRCLAFFNNPRPVRTSSTVQVRKPLSKKSIGRWRRFESYLGPLMAALKGSHVASTEQNPANNVNGRRK